MKQFFIPLISFLITALITVPIFRALAVKLNIVDVPDGKLKKHLKVTPYLGGVAIFTAILLVLIVLYFSNFDFSDLFPGFFWGSLVILIVGLVDDMFFLSPFKKFLGQLCSVFIFIYYDFSLSLGLPFYGDKILSIFWLISLINAFNLIDVMDGLAVTVGASATCSLICYVAYLKQSDLLLLLLIFLGAQLAFFYHNRPSATIYLGDAGSMLLGAIVGSISLKIKWLCLGSGAILNYLIAPIIVGIPIIEVLSLIIIRYIKNIPFYAGSHDHYIHYLKRKGWSEYYILGYTFSFSLLLCVASGLFFLTNPSFVSIMFLLTGLLLLWLRVVFF